MGLLKKLRKIHIPSARFKVKPARFKGLGSLTNRLAKTAASTMFPTFAPLINVASSFKLAHSSAHSPGGGASDFMPGEVGPFGVGEVARELGVDFSRGILPGFGAKFAGFGMGPAPGAPTADDDPLIKGYAHVLKKLHGKRRRMNWANSRALGRAERRLGSFVKHFTKTARFLGLHVGRMPKRSRRGAFGRKK